MVKRILVMRPAHGYLIKSASRMAWGWRAVPTSTGGNMVAKRVVAAVVVPRDCLELRSGHANMLKQLNSKC